MVKNIKKYFPIKNLWEKFFSNKKTKSLEGLIYLFPYSQGFSLKKKFNFFL